MYSAILLGDFRRIELILFSGIMDVSFSCEAANPALPFIGRLSAATSAVPQLIGNKIRSAQCPASPDYCKAIRAVYLAVNGYRLLPFFRSNVITHQILPAK